MTDKSTASPRPLLAKYEVLIFEDDLGTPVLYDEDRMVLMAGGRPAASQKGLNLPRDTTKTAVARETTGDR